MTRDPDEIIDQKQSELFGDDPEEDDGLNPLTWKIIQYLLAIILLIIAVALLLYVHGDKIAGLIEQLKSMINKLKNPTGFTSQILLFTIYYRNRGIK